MIDAAPLIDDEVLVYELFARDFAAQDEIEDITVSPDVDVDESNPLRIPFVTFTTTGDGQSQNGAGLWDCTLSVACMAYGMDAAKALARLTYRIVHGWSDPTTSYVTDVGGVIEVTDIGKPSRQPAVTLASNTLVEYDGTFLLQLRN